MGAVISETMAPGLTIFTLTPLGASSRAAVLARLLKAALVAQ